MPYGIFTQQYLYEKLLESDNYCWNYRWWLGSILFRDSVLWQNGRPSQQLLSMCVVLGRRQPLRCCLLQNAVALTRGINPEVLTQRHALGMRKPSWICYVCVPTNHEGHLVVFIAVQNLVGIDAVVFIKCIKYCCMGLKFQRLLATMKSDWYRQFVIMYEHQRTSEKSPQHGPAIMQRPCIPCWRRRWCSVEQEILKYLEDKR